jgi:hypothetical protein
MKDHQTLIGFITKTKGIELGAQPLRNFTPYKKWLPFIEDDETTFKEFLC